MKATYLVTGSEESKLMFEGLKDKGFIGRTIFGRFPKPITLDDYLPRKGDFPILVGGSGHEHQRSHDLSLKVDELYHDNPDLVKVQFDQHEDDSPDDEKRGMLAGTHIYHTRKAGIFSDICLLTRLPHVCSVEGKSFIDEQYCEGWLQASKLKDKKIHVTLDLDLLKEKYIDWAWPNGRNTFEELATSLKQVSNHNKIVALDIFGASPFNALDSKRTYGLIWNNCKVPVEPGQWVEYEYPNSFDVKRALPPGEAKEIAPSYEKAVEHYGKLIRICR